jgi:hypothetical protein
VASINNKKGVATKHNHQSIYCSSFLLVEYYQQQCLEEAALEGKINRSA